MTGLSSLLEKMRGEKLDARRINEINHERFFGSPADRAFADEGVWEFRLGLREPLQALGSHAVRVRQLC